MGEDSRVKRPLRELFALRTPPLLASRQCTDYIRMLEVVDWTSNSLEQGGSQRVVQQNHPG